MSARYLGGVLSETPLQLNPAAGNAANGVFTMSQYMQAVKAATWPAYDPYFDQTVLLLHGNGTNGAQNNTFLDSSTNNFTITRNGNTTQGTFSPFSLAAGEWSVYHDGSSDYVTAGTTSSFNFVHNTSGLATIEAWIYLNALTGVIQVIASNIQSSSSVGFVFGIDATNKPYLAIYRGVAGSPALDIRATNTISANRWYHIAAVIDYSGNNGKLYIDGVQENSDAFANTPSGSNASYALHIGRNAGTAFGSLDFAGYISNFRIVNSASVYTAAFTVPTSPLTAITDTKLLIHQSNRFVDNSTNAFAITRNGNVRVTPFSPFAPSTAYSPSVNGGSGYFDGSGDYLSLGGQSEFAFGTGDFSIQFWYYSLTAGTTQVIYDSRPGSTQGDYLTLLRSSANKIVVNGASTTLITSTTDILSNSWSHIAVSRVGTDLRLFINGQQEGSTVTNSTDFLNPASRPFIGSSSFITGSQIVGYISDLLVQKGSGYSSFSVPTAPLTAITNTSLLLNFTNAGILDSTAKNNLETVGNAQIDTAVKKFGDGSMEFDGTGDYLLMNGGENFAFGTGDFTIEFWYYSNNTGVQQVVYDSRPASTNGAYMVVYKQSGNVFSIYVSTAARITGTTSINASTWYHIAVCRSGTSTKLFVNGVQDGSTYTDSNNYLNPASRPIIGADGSTLGATPVNGFIDDLRITKGVARYTSNFDVPYLPQGPLPLVGGPYIPNTVLMLPGTGTNGAQNNTFLDSSTNNFTITRNGNTTQGTFSPFSRQDGYWGNYFDGTGDYLTVPDDADFDVGSGDWTIECFANFGSVSGEKGLISHFSASGGNNGYTFRLSTGNSPSGLRLVCSGSGSDIVLQVAWTPVVGTWYHIAAVRDGGTLRVYVDGVQIGSISIAITIGNPADTFVIGTTQTVASSDMNGYISNVRMIKGTCLYTGGTTFTPPAAPLTAIANTSLLTCQSNRFVDNSTNNFTITRNGDVKVTTFSPFEYLTAYSPTVNGGSGYFDGTGDWLTPPDNVALDLTSGDFTLEFWIYRLNSSRKEVWVTMRGFTVYFDSGSFIWTGSGALTLATVNINSWNHIEVVKSGATVYSFVNGVVTNHGSQTMSSNQAPQIGAEASASPFTGYIAGLRVLKGTALHTASFTPPTAPPTAITNTQLLTNFTNAGIYDAAMANDLETVGNAQVSTTQSKWGGGSMYFDGTGDYLITAPSSDNILGSGDFTIEMWLYPANTSTAYRAIIASDAYAATTNGWTVYQNGSSIEMYYAQTGGGATPNIFTATNALTATTWQHFALSRSSGTLKAFVNGTQVASVSNSVNFAGSQIFVADNNAGNYFFNGYISDLRIIKGVAILPTPLQTSQWQDQ